MNGEALFTDILLKRANSPDDSEQRLLYNVLHEAHGPRSPLWAALGAGLAAQMPRSSFGRLRASLLGALYGNEISWTFRDRCAASTFCKNYSTTQRGQWATPMQRSRHRRIFEFQSPAWFLTLSSIAEIVCLETTLGFLWRRIEYRLPREQLAYDLRTKHEIIWVLVFDPAKRPNLGLDAWLRWYWSWKYMWYSSCYQLPKLLEEVGFRQGRGDR